MYNHGGTEEREVKTPDPCATLPINPDNQILNRPLVIVICNLFEILLFFFRVSMPQGKKVF
jgi:hypothetical protein